MSDSLGDRMKRYENSERRVIMPRMPVVIRVDGKAFHSLTRGCAKPFDYDLMRTMDKVAEVLVANIQNARMAYVQSDEISVLLNDFAEYGTQQWFGGNINKMISISAAIASTTFSEIWGRIGLFDSRVFALPHSEVANYFIWRQKDWERNSLQMLARSLYSHKDLHGKGRSELHDLIHAKGDNWDSLPSELKRGRCAIAREGIDKDIPIFTQSREYIERFIKSDDGNHANHPQQEQKEDL